MTAALIALGVSLALGAAALVYFVSWAGILAYVEAWRVAAIGAVGAWWSYLVNVYTGFWEWLQIGATFTNMYFSAFLIGVVAMVLVMCYNAWDTLTDQKKGNFSLIQ